MKKLSLAEINALPMENLLKNYQQTIEKGWIKCPLCGGTDLEIFGVDENYNDGIMLNCNGGHHFAVQSMHQALEYILEKNIEG